MQVSRFIQELLYQYECVTIPNFGAFLTRSFGAKLDDNGNFFPPRKEVTFNQLLSSNDGILGNYVAKRNKISYENAIRIIEKEVIVWKKRLKTQTVLFPGVGEIKLNQENKFEFSPLGKINFELRSYGLHFFERNKIKERTFTSKTINDMEDNNKEDLVFTPDQDENNKKSPTLKYAAIGIIGIAMLGGGYFFSDKYVTEQRIVEQEKAQKKIEKNVQEATFELEDLSLINVVASTKSEKEDIILKQDFYSVIAGSFRSMENATKKLEQLKSEGYPAELAEINPEGIHRVAYGRYLTKKEAINMLYFIKYTLKEEAWYLEEK